MEHNTYTYDEAYEASVKYFDGDELAARVWVSKYALKDSAGNIYELTPRTYAPPHSLGDSAYRE